MRAMISPYSLLRAFLMLLGAALLLVPQALRSPVFLAVEVLTDLAIVIFVLKHRAARGPILTVAVAALLAADTMYAVTYTLQNFPPLMFKVQISFYMLYNIAAAWYLFRVYLSVGPRAKVEPVLLMLLFAVFSVLQIKYVAIPVATGVYASTYVALIVPAQRAVESCLLALAILLGMKARSRYWFLLLNGLALLPLSSFAIGYNTTAASGVPFAEYGWVLGLFSILAAQTYPAGGGGHFAAWSSVRVRLVWFVSSLAAAMLALLYLLQAFVMKDNFLLASSLFFILFAVWFVSNLIALRVSEDIHGLMEGLDGRRAPAAGSGLAIYEAELFAEKLRAANETIKSQSILAAKAEIAAQVAHDIRSPLAALDSALKDVPGIPEDRGLLIRAAAGRINDIANDLLEKNREAEVPAGPGPEARRLSDLIEAVVTEKRLEFRERPEVVVDFRPGPDSNSIFARVRPAEFGRMLSNLVNNGVEALDGGGSVTVSLSREGDTVTVTVSDDGKGIPPEVMAGLGQKGRTHGKEGGSGLGLYHARITVESWGGGLSVASGPGRGTVVSLRLPAASANRAAVLLDDDALVRLNWRMAAKSAGVELKEYAGAGELLAAAAALPSDTPLYIDSDLGGGAAGEDVAEELRRRGFSDITMATGHGPERFTGRPWLKVAGKEPPWERKS